MSVDKTVPKADQDQQTFENAARARRVFMVTQLVPKEFNSIKLTYTGSDITKIEYYVGGLSGTKVATLTLSWTDNNLISVVRT